MDEEEFNADEVWFGDQFRWSQSQGLVFAEDTSRRNETADEETCVADVAIDPNGPTEKEGINLSLRY
jgi:hypothetical protein